MAYIGKYLLYFLITKDSAGQEYIKIGTTTSHPSERMASLQTGCPFRINVHKAFELTSNTYQKIEKLVHQELDHKRSSGEWFVLDREAAETLSSIYEKLTEYHFEMPELQYRTVEQKIIDLLEAP